MARSIPSEEAVKAVQADSVQVFEQINSFTQQTFRTRGGRLGSGIGSLLEAISLPHIKSQIGADALSGAAVISSNLLQTELLRMAITGAVIATVEWRNYAFIPRLEISNRRRLSGQYKKRPSTPSARCIGSGLTSALPTPRRGRPTP